jgi:hypothetical protein
MVLFVIITLYVIASDQRERGNPWELLKEAMRSWKNKMKLFDWFLSYFVLVCNNEKACNLKFKVLKMNTSCCWIATQTSFARNNITFQLIIAKSISYAVISFLQGILSRSLSHSKASFERYERLRHKKAVW